MVLSDCIKQTGDIKTRSLLAEDERSLARAIVRIFEKNNYSADAVFDGEDALAYLEVGNYDVAVMDIMMPKLDGISALKKLRASGNRIPVLMLTAKAGIYEMMITETDGNDSITDYLETAVAVSYSGEYNAFTESGESFLSNLCSFSNGEIFTDMQKLVDADVSEISIIFNPMVLFAVITCILLLADIAVRKLRWKDIRNYFVKGRKTQLTGGQ